MQSTKEAFSFNLRQTTKSVLEYLGAGQRKSRARHILRGTPNFKSANFSLLLMSVPFEHEIILRCVRRG